MSSLPLLQSQIRRDPEGYEQEYRIQFRSFETTAQTFHVTPGRPHKHFQELVSFVAHVYPCYSSLSQELNFPQIIFATLRREPERIHPSARKVLVSAILSLLKRDAIPLMTVLTELFKLFSIEDKELRQLMHGRMLSEISSRTTQTMSGGKKRKVSSSGSVCQHVPPSEMKKRVQEFLMKYINSAKATDEPVLRAIASLVCGLFKRRDWVDDFTVNSMLTELSKCEDPKVSSAAMHIFLGESNFAAAMLDMVGSTDKSSKNKKADPISSDEEDGSRRRRKKPSDSDSTTDFTALDSLIEPYSFTESILKRAMNNGGSFEYRLLALRVVCRAVYRRELVLPNLYPYLEKYLFPSNRHVTKILACLAQACHANVPPDEMQSVVRHVLNNFVSDHCRPEVITVGLNALRGICERAPLALNKDQLMDIVQYRNMKTSKSVSGAARALLNLYRDIHPELLHKSLRGKQAAIAVQRGETERIAQFGEQRVETDISGIDLLVAAKKRKRMDNEEQYDEVDEDDFDEDEEDEDEEEESEEDDEEEEEEEEFEEDDEHDEEDDDEDDDEDEEEHEEEEVSDEESGPQISLATETILSNEDFKRIKKLKSIAAEKGSIDSDDLMSSSDSGSEDGEEEVGDWILNPEKLGSLTKKGQEKKGDATEERKRAMLIKAETRRGGLTNKEKKRMKPLMMSVKKEAGRKRGMSAGQKFKQIRNHISNLKKQIGPQKRRRSGKFSRK